MTSGAPYSNNGFQQPSENLQKLMQLKQMQHEREKGHRRLRSDITGTGHKQLKTESQKKKLEFNEAMEGIE